MRTSAIVTSATETQGAHLTQAAQTRRPPLDSPPGPLLGLSFHNAPAPNAPAPSTPAPNAPAPNAPAPSAPAANAPAANASARSAPAATTPAPVHVPKDRQTTPNLLPRCCDASTISVGLAHLPQPWRPLFPTFPHPGMVTWGSPEGFRTRRHRTASPRDAGRTGTPTEWPHAWASVPGSA